MPIDTANSIAPFPMTRIYYALECTGAVAPYDQVIRAVLARSDDTFATPEPNDRLDVRVRRQPWVVPDPEILLRSHADPSDLEFGLYHHQAMLLVHQRMVEWGPAVVVGYDQIRREDPILQSALYRSLLPHYFTQTWGSCRADVKKIVQAVATMAPETINVPKAPNGEPAYDLARVCLANGVGSGADLYDAGARVAATIALSAALKARSPRAFDAAFACASPEHTRAIATSVPVFLGIRTNGDTPAVCALVPLFALPDNPNAIVCLNAVDFVSITEAELREGARPKQFSLCTVRFTAHEMLVPLRGNPFSEVLRKQVGVASSDDTAACGVSNSPRVSISADRLERCATALLADNKLIDTLRDLVAQRSQTPAASESVDEQIYSGSMADKADYAFTRLFLRAPSRDRLRMIAYIRDPRLQDLAQRIIWESDPDLLSSGERADRLLFIRERLLGPVSARWRTLATARHQLEKLGDAANPVDRDRIDQVAGYLNWLEASARR